MLVLLSPDLRLLLVILLADDGNDRYAQVSEDDDEKQHIIYTRDVVCIIGIQKEVALFL